MGRYLGPVHRLSRREGVNLYLKGGHRANDKSEKRIDQAPGQHGARRKKMSDYGSQLREKQKMKRIYGLMERQFRVFFNRAVKKRGITGEILIELLERRLDNVVYRLLFANSRREARQMVNHGHILVNGQCVSIPSFIVKPGDTIQVKSKEATLNRVKGNLELLDDLVPPSWLELDRKAPQGKITRLPTKEDAQLPVEESLIVELFSK